MNKAFYILFFFFFLQNPCKTQNLIYNGDFEIYDTCPTNFSQPLDYQIEHALGWYAPTQGTSDYFNSCNSGIVSTPSNFAGTQVPYANNGYAGFYANEKGFSIGQCFNGERSFFYREYLQTKLLMPLVGDKYYKLTFYISLAEYGGYASRNIGALFTFDSAFVNCFKPIIANPQISSSDFISDSIVWTKVEGIFKAQGGEQFLTIGNFADTSFFISDTLCVNPGTQWQIGDGLSYYYVDGFDLVESPHEIIIPNIFSPNGDEINEIFKIENAYGKTEMKIFNRWGELVYFAEGRNCYWDGRTYAGVGCPEGVYYYSIRIEEKEFKGFVHLVR